MIVEALCGEAARTTAGNERTMTGEEAMKWIVTLTLNPAIVGAAEAEAVGLFTRGCVRPGHGSRHARALSAGAEPCRSADAEPIYENLKRANPGALG